MRYLLLIVAIIVVLLILGPDENSKQPRVCPSCGVQGLYSQYEGHNRPARWVCSKCGYEAVRK